MSVNKKVNNRVKEKKQRRRPGISFPVKERKVETQKVRIPKMYRQVQGSPHTKLIQAIHILGNNRKHSALGGVLPAHLQGDDVKIDPKEYYDQGAMDLASSLISINTEYDFRLISAGVAASSSGAGLLNGFQGADPSGGGTWTATEWASLITLFSEVKMKSFSITFNRTFDTTIQLGNVLMVSGALSTIAAAPTTYSQVFDNADAKMYQVQADTSKTGYTHTIRGTDLSWAIVTTPNPGGYAGCPGSIQYIGTFTASKAVLLLSMHGVYAFRSRI